MKITQQAVDANLETWKNLGAKDRDKIVYEALFVGFADANSPMFSHNVPNAAATKLLIDRLAKMNVAGILFESLPRSTRHIISWNGVILPQMPAHKGVAYLAYLAALPEA